MFPESPFQFTIVVWSRLLCLTVWTSKPNLWPAVQAQETWNSLEQSQQRTTAPPLWGHRLQGWEPVDVQRLRIGWVVAGTYRQPSVGVYHANALNQPQPRGITERELRDEHRTNHVDPSLPLCRLLRTQERIRSRINPILRIVPDLGTKQTRRIQRRLLHFIILTEFAQPVIHVQRFGDDAKCSRVGFEAALLAFDDLPEGTVVVAGEALVLRHGRGRGCDGLRCL